MATSTTKGIRVNQLAKELGVPSKLIIEKCEKEGIPNIVNHMSSMSLGLAATVREWFHLSPVSGSAVETADPVTEAEVAKARAATKARSRKRGSKKGDAAQGEADTPIAEASDQGEQPADSAGVTATPASEPVGQTDAPSEPSADAATPAPEAAAASSTESVVPAPTEVAVAGVPVEAPAESATVTPVAPVAEPAAADVSVEVSPPDVAPPVEPPAGEAAKAVEGPKPGEAAKLADGTQTAEAIKGEATKGEAPRSHRPTVRIGDTARKAVIPPPQLVQPRAATVQGPRVVRVEKPDVVAAPRRPRPMNDGPAPAFTSARPQAGRGVRVSEEEDEAEKKKKAEKAGTRTLSARRRGADGRRGEAIEKLKEFSEQDLEERRIRLGSAGKYRIGVDSHLKKRERLAGGPALTAVQKGEPVAISPPITVKNLATVLGVKGTVIISKLIKQGVFATINQVLEAETAQLIALDYNIELQIKAQETAEEAFLRQLEERPSSADQLQPRPPVVTILGHVDHGKTSLLDKIRSANVAAGEAGGITQHIAAWMVEIDGKRVTFIDTPGHQAFTSMRARGANMTDMVVLVVSAAEGVQPQTIESINHARAAEVPIVVAMNKIDRPDANAPSVLAQLAGNNINPAEWGGDVEVIRTSAITGQGIPELIEHLDFQAGLLELKANPAAPALGVVIEARIDPGLGPVATMLVQDGTLKIGDVAIAGAAFGRIRSLLDDRGRSIESAGPSVPVIVSGFTDLPNAGDRFYVIDDIEQARAIGEIRANRARQQTLASRTTVTTGNLLATMQAKQVKTINVIIKADVQGSVETLVATVTGSNTEEVRVKVIHSGVGAISESDVELAMATKAKPVDNEVVIIGFHVTVEEKARELADQNHVQVKLYRVIYEIFDDLKKSLSGMLEPEIREKLHGHVEVRQVFKVSKVGNVAGCFVTDGHIQRGSKIRLIRNGVVVTEDLTIDTLRRVKDDAREVKAGLECGIKLHGYDDIKIGDVFEGYIREKIERAL